jgi:hypothetical protein
MKKETINKTILKYLRHLTNSEWIIDEAYKFEFANFLQSNIDFQKQNDSEILGILLRSQSIKFDKARGIQFIQKSGRETLKTFIRLNDISLIRQFQTKSFDTIDWTTRSMSFTALSVWLSSLFPDRLFPIPAIGINATTNYLFETDLVRFPKTGKKYILGCQDFMKQTQDELKNYPIEEIHLKVWNKFFAGNSELNINQKIQFDQVDWNWLTQDFHLYVYRNVLNLYNPNKKNKKPVEISDDFEPIGIEGHGKLATHMRYERDSNLIRTIKETAIKANPMLNCEICGFSFFEKYGELGQGFIEAHHKRPLSVTRETKTTRVDIALVCSNCHRMIHKGISQLDNNSTMTTDELKAMINE